MPSLTCHCFGYNFTIPHIHESQNLKKYFGGDIQKFTSKLPGFIWAKYKGKKHLPSYNYLGPNTRLDIRLNENSIPKSGEEPINAIDHLAYIHDLAYQNSNNIKDRHRADQEMINGLKQLKNLSIPQKLIRQLIIKIFQAKILTGGQLTKSEKLGQGARAAKTEAIKNLYDSKQTKTNQESKQKIRKTLAAELHKQFKRPKQLRKVYFKSKDNIWNADLIIMPQQNGFKYILTVMDGYTRYAWTVPLKDKKGETVANAFKEIMKKSNRKPNKLWVDQGKEFYNQHMYKIFKFKNEDILEKDENGEYKNHIYSVFNSGKNPAIERFNKTLTNKLWKQFTVQENQKWLNILQTITSKYNNTIHRTINTTPSLASKNPSLVKIKEEIYSNKKPKFKINDRVRIFKYKNKFEKGYRGYWTKEAFKVTKINNTNPIMYTIQDLNIEKIQGSFYTEELQKTEF